MNVLFRTDANLNIGMGHIMRCLSIADAFHNMGCEVEFILSSTDVKQLVSDRGYLVTVLGSRYDSLEDELSLWPLGRWDVIVVDSYYVTNGYLRGLRSKTDRLVYIDDCAIFPYPVDVLVNYNVFGPEMDYQRLYGESNEKDSLNELRVIQKKPSLILGPEYTPLRDMFRVVPKKIQSVKVRNVLMSTGGADTEHIALEFVKSNPTGYVYHLLIGALNVDKDEIKRLSVERSNIVIHENVSDMRSLIEQMDIAVSAAGSTLYEICACGIPLITYVIADNQIPGAEAFEKLGLAENIGDVRNLNAVNRSVVNEVVSAVDRLAADYDKRCAVGERMQKLIDGFGADRMVLDIINH